MGIARFLIYIVSIFVTAYILPGVIVQGVGTAVVLAIVLGVLNFFLKPILILFTLPINILTFGLFTFIINAFLILLASNIVPGFYVNNFGWALLFAVILSIVFSFLSKLS
jgi:putative membrane protein